MPYHTHCSAPQTSVCKYLQVYTHFKTESCVTGGRDKIVKWQSEVNIQRFPTGTDIYYRQNVLAGINILQKSSISLNCFSIFSLSYRSPAVWWNSRSSCADCQPRSSQTGERGS